MTSGTAKGNSADDHQYHLEVGPDDVASTVLLPGDPDRIDAIAAGWDRFEERATHREYRTITGRAHGVPISATSTGIGSPSAAIAVEELARVGVDTFIRVGSCGTVRSDVDIGDLVITTGAIRQEGTSAEYVRPEYPAVADPMTVVALITAAERLGYRYHTGITLSTDSFYAGQGRRGYDGYVGPSTESFVDDARAMNVANVEMEASAILTLANLFGKRAGAVCTVYADRTTGEFRPTGDVRAAETATLAAAVLAAMDESRIEAGVGAWNADLPLG